MAGHEHAAPGVVRAGVIYPAVIELIPSQLHLDHRQIATLRAGLGDTAACAVTRQAVIASGAKGGIWVESVR
jgi:N-acetylglucosamine-6-phosphate deacetylase